MLIQLKLLKKSKRYKKSLSFIPLLLTYLNAFFGFLAIINALDGEHRTSAIYILLAACMDMLDGRIARALGVTSNFGMELDSLCDAVSFCLAPAVLAYCWLPQPLGNSALCIIAFYLCAGLARLAKFNLTADRQQHYFIGLPTPVAAFYSASLILYQPWLNAHGYTLLLQKTIFLLCLCGLAYLMVSPIPFFSCKRLIFKSCHLFYYSTLAILLLLLLITGYPLLLLLLLAYILINLLYPLYQFF